VPVPVHVPDPARDRARSEQSRIENAAGTGTCTGTAFDPAQNLVFFRQ